MSQTVTVYSTPFCAACDDLKEYLHRRGIAFTVRDVLIDEEAAELLEAHGIDTTPALSVGDVFVDGFEVERVQTLLAEIVPSSAERSPH